VRWLSSRDRFVTEAIVGTLRDSNAFPPPIVGFVPASPRRTPCRSRLIARAPSITRDDAGVSRRSLAGHKGRRYPADPPKVEEIIAVMRAAGDSAHGRRLRGLIVILWRAGLRIYEALALAEADLDARRGSLLVRRGKGGRRREVGMDARGWTIDTVHSRHAPLVLVSTTLRL
jgi:integrase